jgi:hypothetical protein
MKKMLVLGVLVLCVSALPAMAAEYTLQEVFNNITIGPNPGVSSVNAATDYLPDGSDAYWQIGGSGGAISTIVIELTSAIDTQTFGIYDKSNIGNTVQIFGGGASLGSQASISIYADGSVYVNFVDTGKDFASGNQFGFYFGTFSTFYSDSILNGKQDRMLAFQGEGDTIQIGGLAAGPWSPNEYALAWEDGSDWDYQDLVVLVESVSPVPVPGAILLGLLGIGAAGLKLRRFA